jgi:hypothetical protein
MAATKVRRGSGRERGTVCAGDRVAGSTEEGHAVKEFLSKHADAIAGVLSGFDRLVFRGSIRQLASARGMMAYLNVARVLLKNFGTHVEAVSRSVKEAIEAGVAKRGRPIIYLASSHERKEDAARAIAHRDGIDQGIICLFRTLEAGPSFEVHRDRATKSIELQARTRRCLFLYLYQVHPQVGFMHVRLQSWFPFNVQVWINGREWLARQMGQAGLGYRRAENCFVWLEDAQHAQQLMHSQLHVSWPAMLNRLLDEIFPIRAQVFGPFVAPYYWSVYQSEWATDVMFRNATALSNLYRRLLHHGITAFSSTDVMRFLGRRVTLEGHVHARFEGEVISTLSRRPEGVRIKHCAGPNSVKLYDKHGSVLRFETTINQPKDIKVFRAKEGDPTGRKSWLKLRRGVADLYRRAQVSQAANDRYAQALACVEDTNPLGDTLNRLSKPTTLNHRRVRGLRPWSDADLNLLRAVNRGEFTITGIRNRDLTRLLFPTRPHSLEEQRRRSNSVSRQLRMLRAHGLIKRIPHSYRYLVTTNGRRVITNLLIATDATPDQLARLAA